MQQSTITSCTRCGKCCKKIPCMLAQCFLGVKKYQPCPALEKQGEIYSCGLVSNTQKYMAKLVGTQKWKHATLSMYFSILLGIGRGCDSTIMTL